jgi:hypothetical protein
VLVVQHREIQDPDFGADLTIKIWKTRRRRTTTGRAPEVTLLPDSHTSDYAPIVLSPDASREVSALAELIEVLPG